MGQFLTSDLKIRIFGSSALRPSKFSARLRKKKAPTPAPPLLKTRALPRLRPFRNFGSVTGVKLFPTLLLTVFLFLPSIMYNVISRIFRLHLNHLKDGSSLVMDVPLRRVVFVVAGFLVGKVG